MKKSPEEIKITNEVNQVNGLLRRLVNSFYFLRMYGLNTAQLDRSMRSIEQELPIAVRNAIAALNTKR